ncbi:hypothetical protein [Gordonia sp. OPL2]
MRPGRSVPLACRGGRRAGAH